jgi:hypothetical protein
MLTDDEAPTSYKNMHHNNYNYYTTINSTYSCTATITITINSTINRSTTGSTTSLHLRSK